MSSALMQASQRVQEGGRLVRDEHRGLCTRRPTGKRMTMQHFVSFLEFTNMTRPNTGINQFVQRMIFRRSQMEVRASQPKCDLTHTCRIDNWC